MQGESGDVFWPQIGPPMIREVLSGVIEPALLTPPYTRYIHGGTDQFSFGLLYCPGTPGIAPGSGKSTWKPIQPSQEVGMGPL